MTLYNFIFTKPIAADNRRRKDDTPSYLVEHLTTFGVGPQFGLQWPNDGIRKLKQMERSSAIWAQRMVLKLRREAIVVEDENGEIVEQFPLDLVAEPTAHLSNDPRDVYKNLLVFIVNEDRQKRSATPTEMHIFQCKFVSANEVADDIRLYLNGRFTHVPPGLRDTGFDEPYPLNGRGELEPSASSYPIPQSRSFEDRRDDISPLPQKLDKYGKTIKNPVGAAASNHQAPNMDNACASNSTPNMGNYFDSLTDDQVVEVYCDLCEKVGETHDVLPYLSKLVIKKVITLAERTAIENKPYAYDKTFQLFISTMPGKGEDQHRKLIQLFKEKGNKRYADFLSQKLFNTSLA